MISRTAIFLIVVCAAVAMLRTPRETTPIAEQTHGARSPLHLPLGEEIIPRSGAEVRVFGAQPRAAPATTLTPLRIDLLIPGRATHLPASTIADVFAEAHATLEGFATDPDSGELFAWGADRSGSDIVVIATPAYPIADFNDDASVSSDDCLRFLELLGSAHPRADLDSNGVINATDLQRFLDNFLGGR